MNGKELVAEIEKMSEKYGIIIFDYIALELPGFVYKTDKVLPKEIEAELFELTNRRITD